MDISNLSASITLNEVAARLFFVEANIITFKKILLDKRIVTDPEGFDNSVHEEVVKLFEELFGRTGDVDLGHLLKP